MYNGYDLISHKILYPYQYYMILRSLLYIVLPMKALRIICIYVHTVYKNLVNSHENRVEVFKLNLLFLVADDFLSVYSTVITIDSEISKLLRAEHC